MFLLFALIRMKARSEEIEQLFVLLAFGVGGLGGSGSGRRGAFSSMNGMEVFGALYSEP